ncbi:hypothetical protein RHSIM_Rhsim05G0130200 [Rhododendron simsii]|uniref:WAT1-related protein n=1 Tax=Rhododendron simsii TaxID=118357 RepID=A0A834H0T0_RHOSS|nr:hypothetical protein RHSIM_Rhsim05G0130200 [Rhododendron simsii]
MEGDLLPFLTMVIVEVGCAGMNIISKLAMDSGTNPFVHVAYRQLLATAIIAPLAFFLERLESVGIRKKVGQAKVLGTVVCVGEAMLLSFYHGSVVMRRSSIHWKYANNMGKGNSTNDKKFMLGPFLLIASNFSWGAWLIIQAKIGLNYSAPYTTSALICLMASIESGIIGISVVHDLSAWSLSPIIRVVSTLYAATVCTALAFCLIAWCVKRKGPLYMSVFSPLLLIVVAILSGMLLQEKLYVGTSTL